MTETISTATLLDDADWPQRVAVEVVEATERGVLLELSSAETRRWLLLDRSEVLALVQELHRHLVGDRTG